MKYQIYIVGTLYILTSLHLIISEIIFNKRMVDFHSLTLKPYCCRDGWRRQDCEQCWFDSENQVTWPELPEVALSNQQEAQEEDCLKDELQDQPSFCFVPQWSST